MSTRAELPPGQACDGHPAASGFLAAVTPLLICWNERDNLRRTLASLSWARRIVVVDSGSTDGTLELLRGDPRIDVIERPFDDFARQCEAGLAAVRSEWTLSLDADYVLTEALTAEMARLDPPEDVDGYAVAFEYCVHGRVLRGSLYPPRTGLYRTRRARYRMEGHGHRVVLPGRVLALAGRIRHDDRKPLGRWFAAQARYAEQEAGHLLAHRWSELRWPDRLRRWIVITPWLVPLYCLVFRGGWLDGWAGWHYALQRGVAEAALALRLLEHRLAAQRDD